MAGPRTLTLNPQRTLSYRGFRLLLTIVWAAMFRPSVVGKQNIPETGPVVIAPVHRSNLDFAFTMFLSRRKTFFMAKDSLWTVPIMRSWISMMGAFPVKRGTADRDSLAFAQHVLASGEALVLFPEGTRQEGATVAELHDGAAFVAARTGAVIVPVGIGHTERAMPRGAKFPRPVKVHLVVGEPITPAVTGPRPTRREMAATTAQLHAALQRVYDEAMGA